MLNKNLLQKRLNSTSKVNNIIFYLYFSFYKLLFLNNNENFKNIKYVVFYNLIQKKYIITKNIQYLYKKLNILIENYIKI